MKKSLFLIIFPMLLIGGLSGCATSENITRIDYLEPGKIIFPERVDHVAVLNNTPKEDEINSSEILKYTNTKQADIFVSFVDELAKTGYYGQITIADRKWKNPLGQPIDLNTFQEMEEAIKSDIIIALGVLNPKDLDIQVESDEFIANSLVSVEPVFQLYNPKTKKSIFYQPKDTIDLFDSLLSYALAPQTSERDRNNQKEMESGSIIGKQLATHFAPHWKTVERIVFTDYPLFEKSAKNIEINNLDEAIIQNELIYTKNKKTNNKIKAANNLAYLYELKDQLNTAHEWSNIALELANNLYGLKQPHNLLLSYVQSYNTTLKKRIEAMNILNQQLSKFEY